MVEWCTVSYFSRLLKELLQSRCPLCLLAEGLEREQLDKLAKESKPPKVSLCARHLGSLLARVDAGAEARTVRTVLESQLAATDLSKSPQCPVCEHSIRAVARLVASIRRLDNRIRFQKALESGPLFCREHVWRICAGRKAETFARIQRAKLADIRNELAQAELRGRTDIDSLVGRALAYLGPPDALCDAEHSLASSAGGADSPDQELTELSRWDEQRHFERLSHLESAVAALRYRNAVLADGNHKLNLARATVEAMKRDLERDAEALAQARKQLESERSNARN